MLSLLSACQHREKEILEFCLQSLLAPDEDDRELKTAAERLSQELTFFGLTLLPVPLHIIKSLLPEACARCAIVDQCNKLQ